MKTLLGILANRHRLTYPLLTITGTFADGTVGTAYTSSLTIAGGNSMYSLTGGDGVVSGTLPTGLSLSISGSSLTLSGTPTAAFSGSFTVGVDSGDGQSATSVQSPEISLPVFSPADLFSNGQRGGYWNVQDLGTLWQDQAGTIPADTDGDLVARMDDQSGNGNHMLAPSGNEPTLKQDGSGFWYLASDLSGSTNKEYMDFGSAPLALEYDDLVMCVTGSAQNRWGLIGSNESGGSAPYYGGALNSPQFNYRSDSGLPDTTCVTSPGSISERKNDNIHVAHLDRTAGKWIYRITESDSSGTQTFTPDATYYSGAPSGSYNRPITLMLASCLYGNTTSKIYNAIVLLDSIDATDTANIEQWMSDNSGVALP